MNKIILEGTLDMDGETLKMRLDNQDLWNILNEYYLDGGNVKITIEKIEY